MRDQDFIFNLKERIVVGQEINPTLCFFEGEEIVYKKFKVFCEKEERYPKSD